MPAEPGAFLAVANSCFASFARPALCPKRRQKGARLGDNAVLEFRIAHERGALHRMAALVVVDTGPPRGVRQDFGDHARGPLRGAQNLNEGYEQRHEQRDDQFLKQAHETIHRGGARLSTSPATGKRSWTARPRHWARRRKEFAPMRRSCLILTPSTLRLRQKKAALTYSL